MISREDFNKLRELFYVDWLDGDFDDVGVWNNIEKDLKLLELLKMLIIVEENKRYTLGNGRYHICIKKDILYNDEFAKGLMEWLNEEQS